jgi:hypothetical protein
VIDAITRKISPELKSLLEERAKMEFKILKQKLYDESEVWKSLIDSTTESDIET